MNWRSWFNLNFDPAQNSFLRLSEADRYRLAKLWLALFIGAMVLVWFSVGLLSR
jgi:hypothetical protein